ncbi:amidohydrolase family protein [Nocardia sp. 348MFTsu5.1]|uniref:amidohydrolase family protein n=1 Tax=Nocardia sp. 348MFTsu5.1 TaxID=1172185 RepID=UPI000371A52A|nr:amidohydrolase family protein [Nocardia sp. 348MFTsu5.1]
MDTSLIDELKIIDTDTHVIEPPDLWTSRVSVKKWGDLVPHIKPDDDGNPAWYAGGNRMLGVAAAAMAGWKEYQPDHPLSLAEAERSAWDPVERLKRMDSDGIHAQVLYPNVAGFGGGNFTSVKEPALMLDLVRAYNDFLTDYAAVAPGRFVPISALPFWDIDAAVKEIERVVDAGHKGVIMTAGPQNWGQPMIEDPHWDRLWATAQEAGLPINFHIGSGDIGDYPRHPGGKHANSASLSCINFINNAQAIVRVICGGVCHRFPDLNIVSVESGVGWIPFILEALDWQWYNCGVPEEHPEYELSPREYFLRQVYGCFWFERETAMSAIEQLGARNFLYETDYPHPTSMSPGPASIATTPREYLKTALKDLPDETVRLLLQDNAARIYNLDLK